MLDTQKLLYILPNLAYLAEFLPGKKPHNFSIQSFKQFNGKLIKDGQLIPENIVKLAARVEDKLEEGEIEIVLADEMFTNTIIDLEKENEAQVKEHLTEEVIPSLHISPDSHLIETFILSEYKGSFKVQLSTVQHSILAPLKYAFESKKVVFNKIYPLSWTIKSIISLEPSVSLLQLGENLFMAKHYIGVDQPMVDSIKNIDRFVEAIKTLKGVEPSLQTAYLLSNEAVEDELKEKLDDILPIQQLVQKENGDELPNYVAEAMTIAMRTISIDEFEIPEFNREKIKVSAEIKDQFKKAAVEIDAAKKVPEEKNGAAGQLPKPGEKSAAMSDDEKNAADTERADVEIEPESSIDLDDAAVAEKTGGQAQETNDKKEEPEPETAISTQEEKQSKKNEAERATQADSGTEEKSADKAGKRVYQPAAQAAPAAASASTAVIKDSAQEAAESKEVDQSDQKKKEEDGDMFAVDLSKFTSKRKEKKLSAKQNLKSKEQPTMKRTIKNDDGTSGLLKMILVGFGAFALTVAVGIGVGYGVLKLSQPDTIRTPVTGDQETTTEVEEPETIEEEPSPTPEPEIDRSEYSIRVVNATTQAGYAGEISTELLDLGYGEVEAKNAVDTYEPGFYLLMAERDDLLLETMAEDLEQELVFSEEIRTEDPTEEFDAVLVLGE